MALDADIIVIGGGIVGLATAYALRQSDPDTSIIVLEKEPAVATHQTGRNSGVIHSGVYYKPGSGKAEMVAAGRHRLLDFARNHDLPFEICGKVVVAVDHGELAALAALRERAAANNVPAVELDRRALKEAEPYIDGVAAVSIPSAGIIDFKAVTTTLVDVLTSTNCEVRLNANVTEIEVGHDHVSVGLDGVQLQARRLVNCGGLHADRIATLAEAKINGVRIMPFRGEYFELIPAARSLIRNLVYPVPDPQFPFLGAHFTRMIDGSVHAGPNAVPALSREGYDWKTRNRRDVNEILRSPGTWRLARKYWRTGIGEIHRSLSRTAFLKALQRLCPNLENSHLMPSTAGVRAQAIDRNGKLLDDFVFVNHGPAVHVLNAPSPAATASFAIGHQIARQLKAAG